LQRRRSTVLAERRRRASVFAALGDRTRLALVEKLARGQPYSIAGLTEGSTITRQAISKHLRVLKTAGVVQSVRRGRENRFELDPRPIESMREYLDFVSDQWNRALSRLKHFVET